MTLILDYMARHPSPEGDEPFTETLATLLEDVLESETELSAEQLATATQVLASTISAIEDGLFLGEPEPSRDHPSTHPPTATPTAAPNRRSSPDHARA